MKIVFVGLGGVPFSNRATDVRLGAFADLLIECGFKVEIINRFSRIKDSKKRRYRIYEPFKSQSPSCLLFVFLLYVVALLKEPYEIIKSHRREKIDILFVSTGHFADFVVYRFICWFIGAKLVNQYCEAQSSFEYRGLYHSINGYLVDHISPKLWDGAVCISHYLSSSCTQINKKIKTTIVYPLCDFTPFDNCKPQVSSKYVLFCGSIGYKETIDFIVKSYRLSSIKESVSLIMVLAGNIKDVESFKYQNPDIIVESNLLYTELIRRYKEALALLIPLRNNIRDIARFPNKTCEYCAAKGLIITTNVGEMSYVFKDMENALVAQHFSIEEYADKMNWLLYHESEVERIKENSYITGLDFFSTNAYSHQLKSYFINLF